MEKCRECEKKGEEVKIYNPDFSTFDIEYFCEECQDNCLAYCHGEGCGKQIYDSDRPDTNWDSMIPYDKNFESEAERHKAISEMELQWFCNDCCPLVTPTQPPREA